MVDVGPPSSQVLPEPTGFMGARELPDKLYRYLAGRLPSSGRLLDIGCGRGRWMEIAATDTLRVEGVDTHQASVDECRSRGLDVTCAEASSFLREGLPHRVDVISAIHVIEHLDPAQASDLVGLMADALEDGGRLLIVTPNFRDWRIASEVFWLDPTHIRPYPRPLLESMVASAGLRVEMSRSVGLVSNGRRSALMRPLNRLRYGREFDRMNSVVIAVKDQPGAR